MVGDHMRILTVVCFFAFVFCSIHSFAWQIYYVEFILSIRFGVMAHKRLIREVKVRRKRASQHMHRSKHGQFTVVPRTPCLLYMKLEDGKVVTSEVILPRPLQSAVSV